MILKIYRANIGGEPTRRPFGSIEKPNLPILRVQSTLNKRHGIKLFPNRPLSPEVISIFALLDLQAILTAAPGISLAEVEGAALLSRLDSKFIVHEAWLPELIGCVLSEGMHRVLEVQGERQSTYDNCFFDTAERLSFSDHTRGRMNRYKARIRRYRSNGLAFLEVKHKTVHGRTEKVRWLRTEAQAWDAPLDASEQSEFAKAFPYADQSQPVMWSAFERFTLVAPERAERFTVDTGLTFRSADGRTAGLPGCAIIEIKQARIDRRSPLFNALDGFRGQHPPLGRSTRISKYVVGTALTQPEFPIRTYRPILRQLQHTFLP